MVLAARQPWWRHSCRPVARARVATGAGHLGKSVPKMSSDRRARPRDLRPAPATSGTYGRVRPADGRD